MRATELPTNIWEEVFAEAAYPGNIGAGTMSCVIPDLSKICAVLPTLVRSVSTHSAMTVAGNNVMSNRRFNMPLTLLTDN